MKRTGLMLLLAAAVLSGCAAATDVVGEDPAATPSETATPGPAPVTSLDAIPDTRWIGTDSEGDQITFKFEADGQLTFTSYGERYSNEGDRWYIEGDALVWDATFGGAYGTCRYTGTLDVAAQQITASDVCSTGVASTVIELRQPVR